MRTSPRARRCSLRRARRSGHSNHESASRVFTRLLEPYRRSVDFPPSTSVTPATTAQLRSPVRFSSFSSDLPAPTLQAPARTVPSRARSAPSFDRLSFFTRPCDMSEPERPEPASGDGGADRATCRGTWNVHPASPRTPIADTLMSQTNESRSLLFLILLPRPRVRQERWRRFATARL